MLVLNGIQYIMMETDKTKVENRKIDNHGDFDSISQYIITYIHIKYPQEY